MLILGDRACGNGPTPSAEIRCVYPPPFTDVRPQVDAQPGPHRAVLQLAPMHLAGQHSPGILRGCAGHAESLKGEVVVPAQAVIGCPAPNRTYYSPEMAACQEGDWKVIVQSLVKLEPCRYLVGRAGRWTTTP